MQANSVSTASLASPQALPKIKKVLKPELPREYLRIQEEIRVRQMDLDAVGEEIRLLLIHGYLPRIGEPEVWIAGDGSLRIEESSGQLSPDQGGTISHEEPF